MKDVSLFLGFSVSSCFDQSLSLIDPNVLKLYISTQEDSYLQEIDFNGTRYIGKFAGKIAEITELSLLEMNIYSILNKIIPNHPCGNIPLVVRAVSSHPI